MARLSQIALIYCLVALASCTAHQPIQPNKVSDIRLDLDRCPVHSEVLVEATNSVDFERGSYLNAHHDIRRKLYPCAFDDPHSVGEMALVTYCPKCRAAKKKYLRDAQDMTEEEFRNLDLTEFIERQRREFEAEYSKE